MSPVELVHPVPQEDAEPWTRALLQTLLGPATSDDFPRYAARWSRDWRPERTWAYRDGGRFVATLATDPRTLSVPGVGIGTNEVEADALTGVTVAATHRRQGLLRDMISRSLETARELGHPLSILIAAEWPIYGRFGYAAATETVNYTYYTRRPNAALPAPPPGSVRQVEPADLLKDAQAIFEVARRQRAGQIDRRDPWWDRRLSLDGYEPVRPVPYWIVHDGPDGPDGMLAWRVTRDFELDGAMGAIEVGDLIATNETAYRDLWAYLGGIDVVDEVVVLDRPVEEPVRWLLKDARALRRTSQTDFLWVRLLDVPVALSARGYAIPGRLVLDVVDEDLGGYAAGRFVLEAEPDGSATCTPTTAEPDLRLTQRTLASAYLGGSRLRHLAITGGIEERTTGALDRADVMFATPLPPWCQTGF